MTGDFTWTGGTLNSTSNLSNLILDGATALFEPDGGGAVNLGSSISLVYGAIASMAEGTIDVTNDGVVLDVGEECGMNVNPGQLKQFKYKIESGNVVVAPDMVIHEEGWIEVHSGTFYTGADSQVRNHGGKLTLLAGTEAYFEGVATGYGYDQKFASALLILSPGTKFKSDNGIRIQDGKLVTLGESVASSTVTIECSTLYVTGGEVLLGRSGTDYSVHYSAYHYSVLKVIGFVQLQGGTYRPFMQTEDISGLEADRWWATGEFKVGTQNASPTLAPVTINYEGSVVTPPTGYTGLVIQSNDEITKINNNAPNYDTDVWVLDSVAGDKQWWMRAK